MDHWEATVIRQLTTQRHSEDIARGLAAQRLSPHRGVRPAAGPRRVTRLAAVALLAAALALGVAGTATAPGAAAPAPLGGDFCYAPRHGGPALAFPRCLPRPLPIPPGQVAI